MRYLRAHAMGVWLTAGDTAAALHNAVVTGAVGIVTADCPALYDLLARYPAGTILGEPVVVGHRGDSASCLENTLPSAVSAYQKHVDAIELDVYVSRDDRLVVMHDATVDRTTDGSGDLEKMTLAQIKALTVDYPANRGTGEVPTLDEYCAEFKGKDIVLYIELKSDQPQLAELLQGVLDEYDFYSQAVAVSFKPAQLAAVRSRIPALSVGDFSLRGGARDERTLTELLSATAEAGVTMHPDINTVDPEYATLLAFHGLNVYPWTCYDVPKSQAAYAAGYRAITTNCPDFSLPYPIALATDSAPGFGADASGFLVAEAVYRNGSARNVLCAPLVLDGDLVVAADNRGWYVASGDRGTVALGYTYTGGSVAGTRYAAAIEIARSPG